MMPGQSFQDEIADKIKRGCRKTIIILSPDYNQSSWCNYEARLAHHKNPGIHTTQHFMLNIRSFFVIEFESTCNKPSS